MLIPIFGSCPTYLNVRQESSKKHILGELGKVGLEWRSLGITDYPTQFPMREILMLAKHCSGGVILGFSQFETNSGVWKPETPKETPQNGSIAFPTPWNHLEAGILFALDIPLIVFRDDNVSGGVFDNGVTDLFIQPMPRVKMSRDERRSLREVIRQFAARVSSKYYDYRQ